MKYRTHVESMLKGMPEVLGRFPGKGNIAINVYSISDTYRVAIGERIGDEFIRVAESPRDPLPHGADLFAIATNEISPWGEKARIFDIFVEGKLVLASPQ